MDIVPAEVKGSHRTGCIFNVSVLDVTIAVGFSSQGPSGDQKYYHYWEFLADGIPCAIWGYKGSDLKNRFSTFGPKEVFVKLFGADKVYKPYS